MGAPKAALEWHGSTLLRRVTGLVQRSVDGPVVVVGAPGQELPVLPEGIEVAHDARDARGPLQGLAAGLGAVGGRATVAYVSSTDVPLLHPRFIHRVLTAFDDDVDAVVPRVHGFQHPLAAAYRVTVADAVERLIAADRTRLMSLLEECRVRLLDDHALLADPTLAALDPGLDSVLNLNDPAGYEAARARPAPAVTVRRCGAGPVVVAAATLREAAAAAGIALGVAELNGDQITRDPEMPLAAGDCVVF